MVFDTNVILDVLLDRQPFSEPAARLLSRAERGEIQGMTCATSVTTIFYLVRKAAGVRSARRRVEDLLSILDIAPVNRAVLASAVSSGIGDFEDAVIAESAPEPRSPSPDGLREELSGSCMKPKPLTVH